MFAGPTSGDHDEYAGGCVGGSHQDSLRDWKRTEPRTWWSFFFDVRHEKRGTQSGLFRRKKKGMKNIPSYNGDYDEPL